MPHSEYRKCFRRTSDSSSSYAATQIVPHCSNSHSFGNSAANSDQSFCEYRVSPTVQGCRPSRRCDPCLQLSFLTTRHSRSIIATLIRPVTRCMPHCRSNDARHRRSRRRNSCRGYPEPIRVVRIEYQLDLCGYIAVPRMIGTTRSPSSRTCPSKTLPIRLSCRQMSPSFRCPSA